MIHAVRRQKHNQGGSKEERERVGGPSSQWTVRRSQRFSSQRLVESQDSALGYPEVGMLCYVCMC
jgi:hypothetical protein